MFIHDTQLKHLLRPDQYYSAAQFEAEREHVFKPSWQLVASTQELAKPGDYITQELLGTPILIRNMDGELRAFLNVCPHRHSLLSTEPRGWMEQLRCRYHGWEFNAEGRTRRIPDAQSFRPFDRENACLSRIRVDTCGPLVYVSLSPEGPSLREYLGPLYDPWCAAFSPPYRLMASSVRDLPCNWKVVVEIGLETYHSPCVHPRTFGAYPDAEECTHVLEEQYTTFTQSVKKEESRFGRGANRLIRWLGGNPQGMYRQQVVHPNLMFAALDVGCLASACTPLSPTTCRLRAFGFSLYAERGVVAPLVSRAIRSLVRFAGARIAGEDASMYPIVQRGLMASPHRGAISMREERVYAFQEYVSKRCGRVGSEDSNGSAEVRQSAVACDRLPAGA